MSRWATKSTWAFLLMLAISWMSPPALAAEGAKFFRVAEVDGAWWFITPDGKPFFSSGVNVVDVGATRESYQAQRPEYAAFRHYRCTSGWADATQRRLAKWGFNTVAGWAAPEMTKGPLPYTYVLHLGRESGVPWSDVFAPDFAETIETAVKRDVVPRASDPLLIGWFTDNELEWFADTLLVFHISQPAASATRQELVKLLRREYNDDYQRLEQDFVADGATDFDELAAGGKLLFRPGGRGMIVADKFLTMVAEQFYRTAQAAIRRVDKNHLILGDRYHGFCPDAVAEAAGPYVDVVSTNFDQPMWTDGRLPAFYLERLHHLSQRPILISEYYVAAQENRSGNRNTGDIFTTVTTQRERAAALRSRLSWLASRPYVVGADWFQFADEPTFGRSDGEDYNFGLVDIDDRPYDELVTAFAETNEALPAIHRRKAADRQPSPHELLHAVPEAPADPLAGISAWDVSHATVRSREPAPLGDLLVSADDRKIYVAISCNSFIDLSTYPARQPGAKEQYLLRITVGDRQPCVVRFGIGDESSVSDPEVEIRVHQRGLRYVVILALPSEVHSHEGGAQNGVPFTATLEDQRRGDRTTWSARLSLPTKR